MSTSVIVWDLETVPDLAGFAAASGLIGKSDTEVREAMGDKFPKHIYHSIICIGALIAHWEPDHWAVDAVGAPHVGEQLVTFTARILPVVRAEAAPVPAIDERPPSLAPGPIARRPRARALRG